MTDFLIQALPASYYDTESDGKVITFISVAMGAKPIIRHTLDNANVAWLRPHFEAQYQEALKAGVSFTMEARPLGRKPNGWDKVKYEFRKDHVVREASHA